MLPKNSLLAVILGLSAISALPFLSACPSEKTDTGSEETDADADGDADADADADADTDADADGPTCQDVRLGVYAVDETVTMPGLVVTSPVSDSPPGFFVQDLGGGAYHCLFVYVQTGKVSVNTGDEVTVTGVVADYYDLMEIKVASAKDVMVTGSASVSIESFATPSGDWEPYESCLLELHEVTVNELAEYGEATTDWGINIDDLFFPWKDSPGTFYNSITGPLYYSYDAFKLEPRTESDFEL